MHCYGNMPRSKSAQARNPCVPGRPPSTIGRANAKASRAKALSGNSKLLPQGLRSLGRRFGQADLQRIQRTQARSAQVSNRPQLLHSMRYQRYHTSTSAQTSLCTQVLLSCFSPHCGHCSSKHHQESFRLLAVCLLAVCLLEYGEFSAWTAETCQDECDHLPHTFTASIPGTFTSHFYDCNSRDGKPTQDMLKNVPGSQTQNAQMSHCKKTFPTIAHMIRTSL